MYSHAMPHEEPGAADAPSASAPAPSPRPRVRRASSRAPAVPIYQTATFNARDIDDYAALIGFERPGYSYSRIENPTASALASAFAELHGAEAGFAFGSGMARHPRRLLSLVRAGDRIVCTRAVYGSTRGLLDSVFGRLGVSSRLRRPDRPGRGRGALAAAPDTPAVRRDDRQPDHGRGGPGALAELAPRHGAAVVVDNTFASPYLCRPVELGADLVVESATKWLGGHTDVIAGVVAGAARAHRGRAAREHRHGRHRLALQRLPRPARHPDAARAHGAPLPVGADAGALPRGASRGPRRGLSGPAQPSPGRGGATPAPRRRRHARRGPGLARAGGRLHRRPAHPARDRDARQRRDLRRASAHGHAPPARRGAAAGDRHPAGAGAHLRRPRGRRGPRRRRRAALGAAVEAGVRA